MKDRIRWLAIGLVAGVTATVWAETKTTFVTHSALQGIGVEKGVMRRDPTDHKERTKAGATLAY